MWALPLLLRCLTAMREYGYGYAIIGSVGPVEFYQKNLQCHRYSRFRPRNL